MNKIKLIIFLLIFPLFFLLFFSFAFTPLEGPTFLIGLAATDTEIEYPTVPGAPAPTATTTFPEYVKYLFNLSMLIAGLIALGVLVWGGILYLTSANNPSQISAAKNKILEAFLGLIILLSSYLVLLTINPQLAGLNLQPVEPVTGVNLINAAGEKLYVAQDTQTLPSDFNATQVQFISTSTELASVFVYSGINYQGVKREIINTGPGPFPLFPVNNPRSIYFFQNRLGIYLYDLPNYQLSASVPYPVYISGSVFDLGNPAFNFDDKTQSLQFNNPIGGRYGAVLFTDFDYQGQCAYAEELNISNLATSSIKYIHPIGTSTLSSLSFFNASGTVPGTVTFYDKANCGGNQKTYTPVSGAWYFPRLDLPIALHRFEGTTTTLDENILSFEINENFAVLLNTEQFLAGKCQLFFKPETTACVSTLKGSYVYESGPATTTDPITGMIIKTDKVRSLIIISLSP